MNNEILQQINNLAGHSALLDKTMVFLTDSTAYIAIFILLAL